MAIRLLRTLFWAALGLSAGCSLLGLGPADGKPPFWRFPLVEDGRLAVVGEINPSPAAAGPGLVVFTTKAGRVYALDGAKREVRWEFETRGPVESPPAVFADLVVAVDRSNRIFGLELDGKLRWQADRPEALAPVVLAVAQRIVLRAEGATVIGLEIGKGSEAWVFKAPAPIRSGVAAWRDWVVFGGEDGKLRALGQDGRLQKEVPAGGIPVGPLGVAGDLLVVGFQDGTLAGFELPAMKKRWTVRLGGTLVGGAPSDGRRLFLVLSNHTLFCLKAKSGTVLWWHSLPGQGTYSPVLAETHVFVATPSTTLIACPKTGGEKTIAYTAPLEIRSAPFWLAPHIWVGLFEPETGRTTLTFLKSESPPEKEKRP
jgi:outer membrane protein assembly factor BamB